MIKILAGGGSSCSSCCHEAFCTGRRPLRPAGQGREKARARPGGGRCVWKWRRRRLLQSGITTKLPLRILVSSNRAHNQRILHKPCLHVGGKTMTPRNSHMASVSSKFHALSCRLYALSLPLLSHTRYPASPHPSFCFSTRS